ncbi:MAG: apolipoprotein N-acyltransferase [Gordonia polyisoprenivorans]|nr:apolipoprotein N-acyltransferase [Gordonia polyisoprenivorans]
MPAMVAMGVAALSGYLLYLSFAPHGLWYLAPVGMALLVMALRGRSARTGAAVGYIAGLTFFLLLLPWVGVYVGAAPWLALSVAQAVAFAVFGGLVPAVVSLRCSPIWIASCWVTVEAIRARIPLGGFPWGRLAFGQADGPLMPVAAVLGVPGLSFVVVVLGAALAAVTVAVVSARFTGLVIPLVIAVVAVGVSLVPWNDAGGDRRITVAVIQGNVPRLGLDFNAQRRAVLDNHVRATVELAGRVTAGKSPRPDFVVWPENSSDIDPYRNADAADRISAAAQAIGVPILVGAVVGNPGGTTRNSMIVWDPRTGPGQTHDKRRLVPFGEYLPLRGLATKLSPYAAQAGHFVAGTGTGVVTIAGVPVAVATCYEVAFDALVRQSVRAGAQVIAVPTNNATFGRTDMTYQQLAMSRVRAVEYNRMVLVAATSGVSAVVDSDGHLEQRTRLFAADVLVAQVRLRGDLTIAARLGAAPEWLAVAVGAMVAASAVARGVRSRRTRRRELRAVTASSVADLDSACLQPSRRIEP